MPMWPDLFLGRCISTPNMYSYDIMPIHVVSEEPVYFLLYIYPGMNKMADDRTRLLSELIFRIVKQIRDEQRLTS